MHSTYQFHYQLCRVDKKDIKKPILQMRKQRPGEVRFSQGHSAGKDPWVASEFRAFSTNGATAQRGPPSPNPPASSIVEEDGDVRALGRLIIWFPSSKYSHSVYSANV